MLTTIDISELATLDHVSAVSRVGAALYNGRSKGAFLLANHGLPLSLLPSCIQQSNNSRCRAIGRSARQLVYAAPTRIELWEEAIRKLCMRLLPCLSIAAGQDPLVMARDYVRALGKLELISCDSSGTNLIILPTHCLFSITVAVTNDDVDMALGGEQETYSIAKSNMLIFSFGRSAQELIIGASKSQYRLSAGSGSGKTSFDAISYSFGCEAEVLPFSKRLPN